MPQATTRFVTQTIRSTKFPLVRLHTACSGLCPAAYALSNTLPKPRYTSTMAATHHLPRDPSSADVPSFIQHLARSTRILCLCGAGLSAASGLPTFRGAGGYWRTHNAVDLATLDAFAHNPSLVWQFYNYRRHMALRARPNGAHYALAELARKKGDDLLTITQNVDGLSQRAQHPREHLELLHGGLYDVKCSAFDCGYFEADNTTDPIVPALHIDDAGGDISLAEMPLRQVAIADLPQCPRCKSALLRPGVVWFGETLPSASLERVEDFVAAGPIDLIIVIGTSATVYPAAGYIEVAREMGARVAVFNTETPDARSGSVLEKGDWFFQGNAGEVLPAVLEGVIGKPESYRPLQAAGSG